MEFHLVEILILFIGLYLIITNRKLEGRIKRLQYTVDQFTKQTGLPENLINNELRELIEEGHEIKAIKKARETLGLTLIEGKEYVEALKKDRI